MDALAVLPGADTSRDSHAARRREHYSGHGLETQAHGILQKRIKEMPLIY